VARRERGEKSERDQIEPEHGHVASETLGSGLFLRGVLRGVAARNHQELLGTDGTEIGLHGLHSRSSQVDDSLIAPFATSHIVALLPLVSPSMTPSASEIKNPPSGAGDELLAIDCQELYYSFQEGLESALNGATLQLPRGARCLLVGANGGEWRGDRGERGEVYDARSSLCVLWGHCN
jgi:hypothetical protein